MKFKILILVLLISAIGFSQSNSKSFKETVQQASSENKSILLVHVDSDDLQNKMEKRVKKLSKTFVIHIINVNDRNNVSDKNLIHNKRWDKHYNPSGVYPALSVLNASAQKTGVSFSGKSEDELKKFLKSLKAH